MTDDLQRLSIKEQDLYRRRFVKVDGRELFLYGYNPHKESPLPEEGGDVAKGGELRWHPFRREWNIYAAHRQNRTFKPSAADDPLAPSRPGGSPTEIPFTDFELAVFENKFTSLHAEAPIPPKIEGIDSRSAKGRCDVVVYTPEGEGDLFSIGDEKRQLLIRAWIDRYAAHFEQGCQFVMPFESRGEEVGVTLHHPHGQIYGFGEVPLHHQHMAKAFADGYDLGEKIGLWRNNYEVTSAGNCSAFCPPFARFPFETWIAPRERREGLWSLTPEEIDGFSFLLGEMTRRYDAFYGRGTAYMLTLHSAPRGYEKNFHFTAQFYPILRDKDRVKFLASVEQGTGVFTVDVMPEAAAAALRKQ